MASSEKSMPFIKNLASSGKQAHIPHPVLLSPINNPASATKLPSSLTQRTNPPSSKPDRKIRTAALTSLRTFLSAPQTSSRLTTLDVLKLWKGLFYALWMCDMPIPQQQLCAELSAPLLAVLPDAAVLPWLRGFWATMAREWTTGIDVLRMEKFLLLVRRVLSAGLAWMRAREDEIEARRRPLRSPTKKRGGAAAGRKRTADGGEKEDVPAPPRWNVERVEAMLELLADWPLRPDEETCEVEGDVEDSELMPKFVPTGLKLHVLDIWVDEAERVGLVEKEKEDDDKKEKKSAEQAPVKADSDTLPGREVLERINALVEKLRAETLSKAVRIRSKESLADDRLPWIKTEGEEGGEDGEWGGLDD